MATKESGDTFGRRSQNFEVYSPEPDAPRKAKGAGWFEAAAVVFATAALFLLASRNSRVFTKDMGYYSTSAPEVTPSSKPTKNGGGLVKLLMHDFNWTQIKPSVKLKWIDCYEKFECARLEVPLDYLEVSGERAAIALLKYPSKIPPGEDGYRGPVLFNPGGPGGSGVRFLLNEANALAIIIGNDYDLIGFDPRGIGYTTPGLFTFPSKAEAGLLYSTVLATVNSSANALGELHSAAKILGHLTKSRIKTDAEHVTTSVVARDMLSIVNAHGRDKLYYWGFSYGTVLGATFAAMFPENVGRIIIDGVVDSEDYYKGLWSNNLRDTDAVLQNLYQSCVDAGPHTCPIYEDTPLKIRGRVEKLLERLKSKPATYFNETTGEYGLVDYSVAKHAIFRTMYQTHNFGHNLTLAIAEAERGHAEPLSRLSRIFNSNDMFDCDCSTVPAVPFAEGLENLLAIACSDGDEVNSDVNQLREFYDMMAKSSPFFAEVWWIHLGCSGWKIRGKERFTGSFIINTSFPLLLIGNTLDPVTPLWNAHKMSKGLVGSVVLTQDSPGHCTLSATSLCTSKAIRAYFRNGTLPENGTVCSVESSIFGGKESGLDMLSLDPSERDMLKASQELNVKYSLPLFF